MLIKFLMDLEKSYFNPLTIISDPLIIEKFHDWSLNYLRVYNRENILRCLLNYIAE